MIGTICGSLRAKSTPVSCSLISRFRREETTAWPSAVMICGSLQNDVDVLLAACDVRAALDIAKRELYAEVRRCADTILTLPMLLTPRLLLGVASRNLGTLRRTTERQC